MKITKYNTKKEGVSQIQQTTNNEGGVSATVVNTTELNETHLIFGQPFNGTQDVSGDLTNAQNITASGGDLTIKTETDAEGEIGGNIVADGNISAGGNVSGVKFIGDVDADNVTTNSITANYGTISELLGDELNFDSAEFDTVASNSITTEVLNVTKSAHFFQLIIDKVKAAGGAIILSAADGFKVDKVVRSTSNGIDYYYLCWKASDGTNSRQNMWLIGDQALCQTFNQLGSNILSKNKFYWAVVTSAGVRTLEGEIYNYIQISSNDYSGGLSPEVGDEIVMLGSRNSNTNRSNAIYISAYNSLDPSLTAPLICQYKGIVNYSLRDFKHSYLAANGNVLTGTLKVSSGQTVEELVESSVGTEIYKLEPIREQAVVDSNEDLDVDLSYKIIHTVGDLRETVTASSSGYFVRFKDNSGYTNLSFTDQPTFTEGGYVQGYSTVGEPSYLEVELVNGNDIVDRRIVPVILSPSATLEITDSINTAVQNTNTELGVVESNLSNLRQTASSIATTVSQHTTKIDNINGEVTEHTTKISNLEQTADGLTSTVESHTTDINGNKDSISKLTQTADKIQLQVDNISVQIDDQKIVLDGNTEVNGTVNINNDGTGFRLNGSNGETFSIGTNDIGTVDSFQNKTVYNWWHTFNDATINYIYNTKTINLSGFCTKLKAGQRIRITNLALNKADYNFSNSQLFSVTVGLHINSPTTSNRVASATLNPDFVNGGWTYQGSAGMTGEKAAIIDFIALAEQADYYLTVQGTILGTPECYTILKAMLAVETYIGAFGNLTYNGFGFNFGNGKIAYISDDSVLFQMGSDSGLKINSYGLTRLVPEKFRYGSNVHTFLNSLDWIGMNDYIVREVVDESTGGTIDRASPIDEMLVVRNATHNVIIVLPTPTSFSGKSYIIKNYSDFDNVYVSSGLSTVNTAGNIIQANSNVGYNDSCSIINTSGTTVTYRQLMKCGKNTHKLISDGNKWIDCLLV